MLQLLNEIDFDGKTISKCCSIVSPIYFIKPSGNEFIMQEDV